MTDKQLAVLLEQYHNQLVTIYNKLFQDTKGLDVPHQDGDPVMFDELSKFIDALYENINILTND